MKAQSVLYKGRVYVAADETDTTTDTTEDERPDEAEMVKDIEEEPVSSWEDYLQPIIRAIRTQVGGVQVSLINPQISNTYSSPQFGFNIVGFVGFTQGTPAFILEEFGDVPVRFQAYVSPEGKLIQPIEIFTDTTAS